MRAEPIELYQQALQQLSTAVDEIDQAHATLKDIGLENFYNRAGLSIRRLSSDAERLLKELKEVTCDECGTPIAENCQCWRPTE